jgi:hypothetical protein
MEFGAYLSAAASVGGEFGAFIQIRNPKSKIRNLRNWNPEFYFTLLEFFL